MNREKVLVLTPINHIQGLGDRLHEVGDVVDFSESELEDIRDEISGATVVFTNPNKAKFFLGEQFFRYASNVKVVCTASTGTNHIDLAFCEKAGIPVISIRDDRSLLENITSTAELALSLTLASLRNLVPAANSVRRGKWDYEPFVGRQLKDLTVGVIGLGRLGTMYARFMEPLVRKVVFFDPFVPAPAFPLSVPSLAELFDVSDIVSLHVHPDESTTQMISQPLLAHAKKDLLLVNTSRGEILNEDHVVDFLKKNPAARLAVDVLSNETSGKHKSPIFAYSSISPQVLITPHIGGMTREGQAMAFNHAVTKLKQHLSESQ